MAPHFPKSRLEDLKNCSLRPRQFNESLPQYPWYNSELVLAHVILSFFLSALFRVFISSFLRNFHPSYLHKSRCSENIQLASLVYQSGSCTRIFTQSFVVLCAEIIAPRHFLLKCLLTQIITPAYHFRKDELNRSTLDRVTVLSSLFLRACPPPVTLHNPKMEEYLKVGEEGISTGSDSLHFFVLSSRYASGTSTSSSSSSFPSTSSSSHEKGRKLES